MRNDTPRFFVTSAPKSGTHLLGTVLQYVTGAPSVSVKPKLRLDCFDPAPYDQHPNLVGHYRVKHLRQSAGLRALFESRKVIILLRDPRDLCLSMCHYLESSTNGRHRRLWATLEPMDFERRILTIADGFSSPDGSEHSPSLQEWCGGFLQLADRLTDGVVVRYEEFFDDSTGLASMGVTVADSLAERLGRVCGVRASVMAGLLSAALACPSRTKRAGGACAWQWRGRFSPELQQELAIRHGDAVIAAGYALQLPEGVRRSVVTGC